jgi:hypothetical protein
MMILGSISPPFLSIAAWRCASGRRRRNANVRRTTLEEERLVERSIPTPQIFV